MSARPFHPDLRRIAPFLPRRTIGPRTLPFLRAADALQRARRRTGVEIVAVGDLRIRIHRPASSDDAVPALLWIHGGGYVMGTATQDDAVCQYLAREAGALVAAVDYRLAPTHAFPAPLHDCYAALRWLAGHSEVDGARIAVGGASAGGGLAAALTLLARRCGAVAPVFQLLSYPMLDDRTAVADVDDRHTRLWNNRANRFGWSAYLGKPPGGTDVDPLAAPGRCTDLVGLPRAWIGVGSHDLLVGENVAYANALVAAGVDCEIEVIEGAFHGFDSVCPTAGVTRTFRAAQARALRAGLGS